MMPKVETFEQNIVEEIKRKDASLTEISAAGNNVGDDPVEIPKQKPIFLIVIGTLFVIFLGALIGVWYFYFSDPSVTTPPLTEQNAANVIPKTTTELGKLSSTLGINIGRFVTSVEKRDRGYILTLSEYTPVFAYMTRNEKDFIEDLALLFPKVNNSIGQAATTTTATTTTSTSTTPASATSTASSSAPKKVATSTKEVKATTTQPKATTTEEDGVSIPVTSSFATLVSQDELLGKAFSDVTMNNQNMRVFKKDGMRVVYAFVGNNTVLISDSPEGVLTLKSGILK